MKKKLTILIPLCLMIIMAMTMSSNVLAANLSGDASFDGKELHINYSQAEFKNKLAKLLPGDEAVLSLSLSNNGKKTTDWYVENEVMKAFEEGSQASGGAYTYEIVYIDQNGDKSVIYSNDKVGGEDSKGLYEATNSTDQYFYLGRLNPGKVGVFTIKVKIDGETVSNDYQESLADINVNFGVEVVDEKASPNDGSGKNKNAKKVTQPGSKTPHNLVRTGDNVNMMIYVILFALAATALAAVLFSYANERKRRQQ